MVNRLDASAARSLADHLGRRPRPLAHGAGPDGVVVALVDRLSYQTASGWADQPWHDIEVGRWDPETKTLGWTATGGHRQQLGLDSPGRLPEVFNERVTASVVCVRVVEPTGGGRVTISARRNLAEPDGPLLWRLSAGEGVDPATAAADQRVQAVSAQLRAEYDLP